MQTIIKQLPTIGFGKNAAITSAPVAGGLPAGIVFTERFAAMFRAHLRTLGVDDYEIAFANNFDLYDIDSYLNELGENAHWTPLAIGVVGGEPVAKLSHGKWGAKIYKSGYLHLPLHEVVIARWYWVREDDQSINSQWMCATPSPQKFASLRDELRRHRADGGAKVWRLLRGKYEEAERIPRLLDPELHLPDFIRERIESDIVGFFTDRVAELHTALNVPYRRGILLYGPPGNGKTSIIRKLGAMVPQVPGYILRPCAKFDTDDLESAVKRWTDEAPAIFVIEDLDWLLKQVNVSTFLNMLDGIEPAGGGLMLIATTNHPEKLDPAINNRPGRFDVTIEVPNPNVELRREFLVKRLPELNADEVRKIAGEIDGLSFAHLQEILRLSGFFAIHSGQTSRTIAHLEKAAKAVLDSHENASRGFPVKFEVPFGLVSRKR